MFWARERAWQRSPAHGRPGVVEAGVIAIPFIVCAVGFVVGAMMAARWLPDLAGGRVGGLAFMVVCGLVGVALSLAGLNVYGIVRDMESGGFGDDPRFVAGGLVVLLRDSGTVLGLAAVIYLLAHARKGMRGERVELDARQRAEGVDGVDE